MLDITDLPHIRKDLLRRLEGGADIEAFVLLYDLYFVEKYKDFFHAKEREAMQEIVAELAGVFFRPPYENLHSVVRTISEASFSPPAHILEKIVELLGIGVSFINIYTRQGMASCLLKFAPQNPDLLGSGFEGALKTLWEKETDLITRNLLGSALLKIRKYHECHQAEIEPE